MTQTILKLRESRNSKRETDANSFGNSVEIQIENMGNFSIDKLNNKQMSQMNKMENLFSATTGFNYP